ncbi:MAG: Endoglucanase 5A [Firmicutes bacterium ADurb.Bin182]|nr:MAG: Endoglucanase 5A [Firmicutes bacterium ADurb.Bin182]
MKTWKGVREYGALKVSGTTLIGSSGEAVMLDGMSSHGIQWYSKFARKKSIEMTKKAGANVFRVAMYTGEGGYLTNPKIAEDVIRAVDDALSLDMYAIIDWHILTDNDPLSNAGKAEAFFAGMSRRYGNEPGVLYEICNEPNGPGVTWTSCVKPYAERLIPVIRANTDAVILVGCPNWSQDVDIAAADPLDFDNIMYTLHFYAGTHGEKLRDKCRRAISSGAPVFASEWGVSRANGTGGVFTKESDAWLDFLDRYNISRCNWNLSDKDETSAALLPGSPEGWGEKHLSLSGRYVFARMSCRPFEIVPKNNDSHFQGPM